MARILLAEDEPSVREFVQRALVHQGHEVIGVCDGGEALGGIGASKDLVEEEEVLFRRRAPSKEVDDRIHLHHVVGRVFLKWL